MINLNPYPIKFLPYGIGNSEKKNKMKKKNLQNRKFGKQHSWRVTEGGWAMKEVEEVVAGCKEWGEIGRARWREKEGEWWEKEEG